MSVLWATTFSADLWELSGKHLVESFVATQTPGLLVAYTEGFDLPPTPGAVGRRIDGDPFLADFLARNRAVIPAALGGDVRNPECRCKGGPYHVHSNKHRLPCVGYWFCKNAYRWLRKVLAANRAAETAPDDRPILMWVDSDARFLSAVPPDVVAGWFGADAGCVYFKSGRTAIETGIVGYHLGRGGRDVLGAMLDRYATGAFRKDQRWDDCVQLELAIRARPDVVCKDLATGVGPNNTVIQFSPLRGYLDHQKGLHRRSGALK